METALRSIPDWQAWTQLNRKAGVLLTVDWVLYYAHKINQTQSQAEQVKLISGYWNHTRVINGEALSCLEAMNDTLHTLDVEPMLIKARDDILAIADHPRYESGVSLGWIPQLLDAVNFTLTHITHQTSGIQQLVSRAVLNTRSVDILIAEQDARWQSQTRRPFDFDARGNLAVKKDMLYFLSDEPRFWSQWVLGFKKVTETWEGVAVDELHRMDRAREAERYLEAE
ncbi:hypothetical protein F53441_6878 [Fusarium austroafricanum]|uniref:Uncharacterized protein n=1 Tax=Fusarium austroafricanum TaxID=2364996 RepID=A0A8H4KHV3_9HYPO|nr:hypothetical protein F53441_6878 [Fusarium austroafricanum]